MLKSSRLVQPGIWRRTRLWPSDVLLGVSMIELREARHIDLPPAAQLLAMGMCDDPIFFAGFGKNPDHRRVRLHRLFTALLPGMGRPPLLGWEDDRLVGVLGQFPPGTCHTPALRQLRFAFAMRSTSVAELW